jgi:hypothetical protein
MKAGSRVLLIFLTLSVGHFLVGNAHAQSAETPGAVNPGLTCSPAPCVLPPTQASEGGYIVTDAPIVSNPLNPKHLLLGSFDGNCPGSSALGFHLSRDDGSTWKRKCMPSIITKTRVYWPGFDPLVGYDRNGAAYIAGEYGDSEVLGYGLVAFQKSTDGTHWSKPAVALRQPGLTFPFETALAVDTNASSPRVNSLYVSGIMWSHQGYKNQVLVSHSTDGGATWKQVAADAVQTYPASDDFTRMAVGKDGTVYLTWMRCPGTGPDKSCSDYTGHMMFSKSTDGGNTWSPPRLMTKATFPPKDELPNTGQRIYIYPVIGVDNGNGPHTGNLYVVMNTWTGVSIQVQVIRSADGGSTWSQPVPVAPGERYPRPVLPLAFREPYGEGRRELAGPAQ